MYSFSQQLVWCRQGKKFLNLIEGIFNIHKKAGVFEQVHSLNIFCQFSTVPEYDICN